MNNTEEQHPVFIPRNFIEKGTFMGGMFKIRNAIEGGILAILITIPVVNLPLTLTVRIIILCMTFSCSFGGNGKWDICQPV
jgi:conjugal transfer ATP-binding protein TraC